MKITSFIIALILVGVVATTFGLFIGDLGMFYNQSYDNTTLQVFDASNKLTEVVNDIEEQEQNATSQSGFLDILGEYVGKAVATLRVAKSSYGVYESMTNATSEKLKLPAYFTAAFWSIMMVLIIIGVIVAAMVKRDL